MLAHGYTFELPPTISYVYTILHAEMKQTQKHVYMHMSMNQLENYNIQNEMDDGFISVLSIGVLLFTGS